MKFSIRQATRADAELIADISRQTFKETFAADNTEANMDKFLNEQFTWGKLILEVGAPGNIFFLAYNENNIAGYLKLRDVKGPAELGNCKSLELARIYAVKDYIGKGIGNFLMEKTIEIAKEKGKEVVWLGVWEKNQRAFNFYNKWGFEKFADSVFLLGDDEQNDWLMKKHI